MKILFNCLVHQNNNIVEDIINNIKKFVENPIIVLHANTSFENFDIDKFSKIENVYINPERFSHGKYDTKVKSLTSNYVFIKNKNIDFDYHMIFYSQMLFVKRGIESYLKDYDSCVNSFSEINNLFTQEELKILKSGTNKCLVEGLIFNSEICENVYSLISNTSLLNKEGWCLEEWIFPSLIKIFSKKCRDVPMNHQRSKTHCSLDEVVGVVNESIDSLENFYTGTQKTKDIFIMFRVDYDYYNPIREYMRKMK